jgi:hypothetical protein
MVIGRVSVAVPKFCKALWKLCVSDVPGFVVSSVQSPDSWGCTIIVAVAVT